MNGFIKILCIPCMRLDGALDSTAVGFLNVLLGALCGALISLPIASLRTDPSSPYFFIVLGLFTVIGGVIGWRRRNSRLFLYISLVAISVLLVNYWKTLG